VPRELPPSLLLLVGFVGLFVIVVIVVVVLKSI
jgi:hypothetical protein